MIADHERLLTTVTIRKDRQLRFRVRVGGGSGGEEASDAAEVEDPGHLRGHVHQAQGPAPSSSVLVRLNQYPEPRSIDELQLAEVEVEGPGAAFDGQPDSVEDRPGRGHVKLSGERPLLPEASPGIPVAVGGQIRDVA